MTAKAKPAKIIDVKDSDIREYLTQRQTFTDGHGEHIRYTVRNMGEDRYGVFDRMQNTFVTASGTKKQAQAARYLIEKGKK
jgi:hypothetical protein